MRSRVQAIATWLALVAFLGAQQVPPPAGALPGASSQPAQPAATAPQPAQPPAMVTPTPSGRAFLQVENASLKDVIDALARQLKINYILDPRVNGAVTVKTYGELRELDPRALLDTILRVNGAAMVQVGNLYRIVPLADATRLPMPPQVNPQQAPDDEQVSLNLIFLKYAMVADLSKLLERLVGEGATMITYPPANLLLILDSNRSMRRTMELIALFDSDALASQRVRLFEVKNGSPVDIAKELDTVFGAMSMAEKGSAVRFMPIERINSIMAVAPNPGVFEEVDKWVKKLDVPVRATAGSVDNYVYRVKYGYAEVIGGAIMQLYLGVYTSGYGGYGGYGGMQGGYGGYGGMQGGYGGYGGMQGGYGGYGGMQGGYGGYGGMQGGYGGYGGMQGGFGGLSQRMGGYGTGSTMMIPRQATGSAGQSIGAAGTATAQQGAALAGGTDLSGSYLAAGAPYFLPENMPRVVPNPMDNTLLIQASPQEYEKILKLLKQLDVPPRQVLIEAKIYEVTLTGAFAMGVTSALERRTSGDVGGPSLASRVAQAAASASGGLVLTAGTLVGRSRQLLAILTATEDNRNTKVISAPVVIATDSIPASINVGQDVPTLTSQAVTGVQQSGSSLFANTVSTRNSGVTLSIVARINPSGVVTMMISQEVSSPQAPAASAAIQSPSFSTRNVQTQVTVEDGDTIAIGGIIQESDTSSTSGVPYLSRIPFLGAAFGAKSTTKERTELVVFLTPRVIYDTNSIAEATEEVKSKLKRLSHIIQE